MFVKLGLVQFLTSVSVAAMFIVAPVVGRFDASGKVQWVSAVANAQDVVDPIDPPPPPPGPIDPPPMPPTDPVDPPTDPVDPPSKPIDPIVDKCDEKGAPASCSQPKPIVRASTSDDRDEVPASKPAQVVEAEKAAKAAAEAFVKTVQCPFACTFKIGDKAEIKITVDGAERFNNGGRFVVTLVGNVVTLTTMVGEQETWSISKKYSDAKSAADEMVSAVLSAEGFLMNDYDSSAAGIGF